MLLASHIKLHKYTDSFLVLLMPDPSNYVNEHSSYYNQVNHGKNYVKLLKINKKSDSELC